MHHFVSLKNDLIPRFFNENVYGIFLIMTIDFVHLPPILSHLHPLQVENCDSNSRLVVDEDDNGKFRPERVNT